MAGLVSAGHDVRGVDAVAAGDGVIVADLASDTDVLDEMLDGADAVVHLAAIAAETDFETAVDSHIGLTHRVLNAAVAHRVRAWCTRAATTPSDSRRGHRCSRSMPRPDPTASTASARPPARPCAACTTTAMASPSPASASVAFATTHDPSPPVHLAVTR